MIILSARLSVSFALLLFPLRQSVQPLYNSSLYNCGTGLEFTDYDVNTIPPVLLLILQFYFGDILLNIKIVIYYFLKLQLNNIQTLVGVTSDPKTLTHENFKIIIFYYDIFFL